MKRAGILKFCTSGIEENVSNSTVPVLGIFDLQGRHMAGSIDSLPAGIYLVNGKKVVKQ